MPEELIHKLIIPTPSIGTLHDLVLCWKNGIPYSVVLRSVEFSTTINDVTCDDCWELWKNANYTG